MIEIVIPEWLSWLIVLAIVLHAIKSVMEIYLSKTLDSLMKKSGDDGHKEQTE